MTRGLLETWIVLFVVLESAIIDFGDFPFLSYFS